MLEGEVKTKQQLLSELEEIRQKIRELEASETKRQCVEEALRESEEFSSSLLQASPIPIMVIKPDTTIEYVNPALEELTGLSAAELIGKKAPYPWWRNVDPIEAFSELYQIIREKRTKIERLIQNNKSGEIYWVESYTSPVMNNGILKYCLSNWVDITERKRSDEKLSEYRNHLEELVEERTMELKMVNKRLEQEINERSRIDLKIEELYQEEKKLRTELEQQMKQRIELITRIQALVRRQHLPSEEMPLVYGPLQLDRSLRKLRVEKREISLTTTESLILFNLMKNAERVVSTHRLAEILWDGDYPNAADAIRVYVRRLRGKIEIDPSKPQLIHTETGLGYILKKSN